MIGNREITVGQRAKYWRYFLDNSTLLPTVTRDLIEHIDCLNKGSNVGFRRLNLATLLAKYFFDMRKTLEPVLCIAAARWHRVFGSWKQPNNSGWAVSPDRNCRSS